MIYLALFGGYHYTMFHDANMINLRDNYPLIFLLLLVAGGFLLFFAVFSIKTQ